MAYWIPAYLAGMKPYLDNPNVSGMYGMWDAPDAADVNGPYGPGVPGEGGVDLDSPTGTPVYALASGPVVGVGYWKDQGNGVVTTRVDIPGFGSNDLYYQHIIFDPALKIGSKVQRGQKLGTVGQYAEVELGLNANWGQPWGTDHPQGWVLDPRPQIKALMALGDPGKASSSSSGVPLTRGHFINEVLLNLAGNFSYTPSLNITNFMISWTHLVNGSFSNACAFNLLNTTQDEAGATQCSNGLPGVKSYPDAATGLKAMVDAISDGHYPNIKHALTTNDENNLGFNGHPMANDIAQELSFWATGKRTPLAQNYILKIMAGAGISNAQIQGGTANGGPANGPGKWGDDQMPGSASDVQPPGNPVDPNSIQNLVNSLSNLNTFFGQLSKIFSNPAGIIKVLAGALLVIAGIVLGIKSLVPGGK